MSDWLKTVLIVLTLLSFLIIGFIGLGDARGPLILAIGLSYLLFPVVRRLEKWGLHRVYSIPLVFLVGTLITIGIFLTFVPGLIADLQEFLRELPANFNKALTKAEEIAGRFGFSLVFDKERVTEFLKSHVTDTASVLASIASGIKSSFTGITSWLLAILNLFLIPVFMFYVLYDFENYSDGVKSFIPPSIRPKISHYLKVSNGILSSYIRGQAMVALALAVLYAIGLWLVGLKFGILIGLISGLISIIPYAGLFLGFSTAMVIGFANYESPGQIIGIALVYILVQTMEGFYITPKLVGDTVGLSALATIIALIIGGNLLGFFGMLVAVPIAAIVKTLVADLKEEYLKSQLYQS